MRVPFNGSYPLTQGFGSNPQLYAQFGLKGHNGLDFGLTSGTLVLAAISGTVSKGWDPSGYGNYVFVRGAGVEVVTAHLQSISVGQGQQVAEGQPIGFSDNTGFSTAAHLHFGVRPIPYSASNGFAGYVDPGSYLSNQQGGDEIVDNDMVNKIYELAYNEPVSQAEHDQLDGKVSAKALLNLVTRGDNPRRQNIREVLNIGDVARRDHWDKQIADLSQQLQDCKGKK